MGSEICMCAGCVRFGLVSWVLEKDFEILCGLWGVDCGVGYLSGFVVMLKWIINVGRCC